MADHSEPASAATPKLAYALERNIAALQQRYRTEEQQKNIQDRIADLITRFTGSMLFVYLHIGLFGLWILINLGGLPLPRFDPTFVILAMFASVEAIFLSTFVLISQNRMTALAEKRAELDLQISLLTEREVTRVLTLVAAMAEQMHVQAAFNPELTELASDVTPEQVLDKLEELQEGL